MSIKTYVAILTPESYGRYTVEVPDLDGCMTEGDTIEEAVANAREAMSAWITGATKDGETIPEPSSAAEITKKKAKGDILALVEAPPVEQRVIPVSVSFREDVLRAIDANAKAAGMTRSGWLAHSATGGAPFSTSIPVVGTVSKGGKVKPGNDWTFTRTAKGGGTITQRHSGRSEIGRESTTDAFTPAGKPGKPGRARRRSA